MNKHFHQMNCVFDPVAFFYPLKSLPLFPAFFVFFVVVFFDMYIVNVLKKVVPLTC